MKRLNLAVLMASFFVLLGVPTAAQREWILLPSASFASPRGEVAALADVTFQKGVSPDALYAGVADTYIESENRFVNHGTDGLLRLYYDGRQRSLLRFDLSAHIPSNAVVTAARLELYVQSRLYDSNSLSGEMGLYEVLRPWEELEATWEQAAKDALWTASGCNHTIGSNADRAAEFTASTILNARQVWVSWSNVPLAALVQKWVNDPATNHGVIIVGLPDNPRQSWTLHSSQSLTAALRPKLTFSYFVATPSRTPTQTVVLPPTTSGTATGTALPTLTPTPEYSQSHVVGRAWHDENRDGLRQPGEPLLANVTIILKNEEYQEVARRITGSDGLYEFGDLAAGNYVLTAGEVQGYFRFWPPDGVYAFSVSGTSHLANLDFGFVLPPTATPTASPTASPTGTATGTATPTATPFGMPTWTPTISPTPTATVPTETPTLTPSPTASPSPTQPPAGTFADPVVVQCQHSYVGTTAGHAAVVSDYGICGSGLAGPEVVYRLDLASTMAYLSVNLNTSADLLLFVVPDTYSTDCLSMGQSVLLANVHPGTYYFVVDGYDVGSVGTYALEVMCMPDAGTTVTPTPILTASPTATAGPSTTPTTGPTLTPTTRRTPGGTSIIYLPLASKPPLQILADCGGNTTRADYYGQIWLPDRPYQAGSWGYVGATETFHSSLAIAATHDSWLYQNSRFAYGAFGYAFDVPNGTYDVELHFAELYYARSGRRSFNVSIEGQLALQDYDIVDAAGGWLRARVETRQVVLRDQQLNVDFSRGSADFPIINAIKITKVN